MKIINQYVQIEPVVSDSFVTKSDNRFDEIGVVVQTAESVEIPVGAKVYFDSWMCKKYPNPKDSTKLLYFVHIDEIVAYEDSPLSE